MVLNCKNTFCEIKSLSCIHEVPLVKFGIFETHFAKVKSLEIFSHKNIFSKGIINLTNSKGSYAQKHRKCYLIFTFSTSYFYTICCNNASEQKLSHYVIKSILNWLDLITIKTLQTAMINKDDCTFSVVYNLLKIKSKTYIFENIFKIPWNM